MLAKGILAKIEHFLDLGSHSSVYVLTDSVVEKLWGDEIRKSLKPDNILKIKSGESSKNFDSLQEILSNLNIAKADRKSLLINIGGGMITDLGGFAASTYMRGIDFVQIPTTLLAQVDASVGGKTGINFNHVKNLVGTFSQPEMVIIDIDFLSTLPEPVIASGMQKILSML